MIPGSHVTVASSLSGSLQNDLASFVMIMKHAEASKGLLWSCKEHMDGQDFTEVVKTSAAPEFRCSWRSMWPVPVCDSSSRGVVRTLSYNSRSSEGAATTAPVTSGSCAYLGTFFLGPAATPICTIPCVRRRKGINVSHHVDHVSFSTCTVITFVIEHFSGAEIVSPLDRCIK